MKILARTVVSIMVCTTLFVCPVFAQELSNYEMSQRIRQLEEKMQGSTLTAEWLEKFSFSGAIEIEACYEDIDYADAAAEDEDSSDLSLTTAEFGVDVEITDLVGGHILFSYEDDEDVVVDDTFITIGGTETMPFSLVAGKMYLPFGTFESNMISDPIPLDLGETRETAVLFGVETCGFYGSVYAFNGDIDEDGKDSHINNFGMNAGYVLETDLFSLDIGAGYINNLIDSNGWSDTLDEELAEAEETGYTFALREYVPGFSAHGILTVGGITLIGEFVTALDEPEYNLSDMVPGSLAGLGLGSVSEEKKASAWNAELGYTFDLAGRETTVGAAYQGSDNMDDILPEHRYMGVLCVGVLQGTSIAFEYFHEEYKNDDEADVLTAQLAVEF